MADITNIMSSDIFLATKFVEKLKAKYIDISEDTLLLGMYGYLSVIFSNLIQNTATMVSEYSTEAIPTKAKFEKNVISHALSLGLNSLSAKPAQLNVLIAFPEEYLVNNMTDNLLILDKEYVYSIGERKAYPYLLDYDIHIKRNILPNGKTVYTAMYDIDNKNPLSTLINPYLPALGIINAEGQDMVALQTTLRQMNHSVIHHKLTVDNPLETKTREFTFENQLAFFYVEVKEETSDGVETHYLEPIYEGLYDYKSEHEYINYMYLDERTIRIKFNRKSYQPRKNSEVDIHIYTTLGSECNLYLDDTFQTYRDITSTKYNYSGLYAMIRSNSYSLYGENRASLDKLKEYIPQEMFARGSYSTYQDLATFFNLSQTDNCKVNLFPRVYNQLENVYYAFMLLKYNNSVIPTNTLDITFDRSFFSYSSKNNFIINPGATFIFNAKDDMAKMVDSSTTEEDIEEDQFLYICPFLMVINKNPFYASFYNVYLKYERVLYFESINSNSELQFIAEKFRVYKKAIDNPNNEFHLEVQCMQNINTNYDLLSYDDNNELTDCNLKVFAVFYTKDADEISHANRYLEGTLIDYDEQSLIYTFDFIMTTQHIIAGNSIHMLFENGLQMIGTGEFSPTYLEKNVEMKLFIFVRADQDYGRTYGDNDEYSADELFPELDGWTLTNIYNAGETGIDIFYDYSDLMTSYIEINKENDEFIYSMYKVPMVKKSWWNDEYRTTSFLQMLDYKRRYIQEVLPLIDNPFGINFKLYNTYGPSQNFLINKTQKIDKVNLSLRFEIMFVGKEDQAVIIDMKESIKRYIEDINTSDNIHIPNLITYIKNLYNESIEYIKFIQLNNYESLWQSIYKDPEVENHSYQEAQRTPEFININTLPNGSYDIEFDIVQS